MGAVIVGVRTLIHSLKRSRRTYGSQVSAHPRLGQRSKPPGGVSSSTALSDSAIARPSVVDR